MQFLTKTLMITAAFGLAGLGSTQLCGAVELTAPALVESSLRRFAHDDADMVRRVDEKAYERLAKEENDFAKDADLLRAAIRSEPTTFQRTVDARIEQVLAASHDVALAGQMRIDTQLRHALEALAEAVRNLNAEFPQSLRSTV
jgi:leucyl aminopeptidase (aminopeptidase T)